jgi:hypothetical protein
LGSCQSDVDLIRRSRTFSLTGIAAIRERPRATRRSQVLPLFPGACVPGFHARAAGEETKRMRAQWWTMGPCGGGSGSVHLAALG